MSLTLRSALLTTLLFAGCTTAESDNTTALGADETDLSAKELLGKKLFEDTRLSEPRGQACSSCHDPKRGFSGDAHSKVPGVSSGAAKGVTGNRNTPTAMYSMFSPPFSFVAETEEDGSIEYTPTGGQFWDGRADTLEDQAKGPFLNPREMNNPSAEVLVAKVRDAKYADLFREVYGDGALDDTDTAFDHMADAIGTYESSERFRPFASKFDAYLRGEATLPPDAAKGFELFKDPEKGNCISCHVGTPASHDPADWLFTDFTYDNLGVPRNERITDNADPSHFDLGLCEQPGIETKVPAGLELGSLCGAFKVPTLRNIAVTGPYMHNGRFDKLRDVVRFYVTRDTSPSSWYPSGDRFNDLPPAYKGNVNTEEAPYDRAPGQAPRLNDREIDQVVAFLETLTDARR